MNEREKKELLNRAGELLALGRGIVKKRAPYIATTLYGLIPQPVWDPRVTIGVSPGMVLYFNPEWILNDPELQGSGGEEVMAGCLYHECWHPLHGFKRIQDLAERGMRKGLPESQAQMLANIADDLSINFAARSAGWKLPSWVCYPEKFGLQGGLLMEEYWKKLIDQADQIPQLQSAGDGEGEGDSSNDGDGPGQSEGEGSKGKGKGSKKKKPGPNDWKAGPCSGQCGGGAGNQFIKDLEQKLDAEMGRTQADKDRIQRTTVDDMRSHEARGRGSITGFREEDFKFLKQKPLVRWERQFRHILTLCTGNIVPGDEDYTMSRPDKNSSLLGIYLPGTIDIEPEVAFIRDTSGSMGAKQLNAANNEIIHAMKALGLDHIWLLDADTEVKGKPRRVGIRDIPKLTVRGRGGTSFVEPLASVKKLFPRPDVVVYLTDGDGYAPDKKPREFEVIWCIVPSSWRQKPAEWGHLVYCSNDREEREQYAQK